MQLRSGTSATPTQPERFRLLDLPPDFWVNIGKLVIDDCDLVELNTLVHKHRSAAPPAITQTCSVLRTELLPYFYQTKIKVLLIQTRGLRIHTDLFCEWLGLVTMPYRSQMRGLILMGLEAGDVWWIERYIDELWKAKVQLVFVEDPSPFDKYEVRFT